MTSRTLTISIERAAADVFEFIRQPANLTQWLTFITGVFHTGEQWVLDTPGGPMTIQFVESNPFGVLDHWVGLPDGSVVLNPMRVVPNGVDSEVSFTLFQTSGMSDADFAKDAATVEIDLQQLKRVLEQ